MGFRSTFVSEDFSIAWPDWFIAKYAGGVHFPPSRNGAISSVCERKFYDDTFVEDVRRAIDWGDFDGEFVIVFLHECGGITRCQIERNRIVWSEPDTWRVTDQITHSYCYGCSDVVPVEP